MAFNNFPNFDMNTANLDWIMRVAYNLQNALNGGINDIIREEIDKLFLNSMYEEDTETLVLVLSMEDEQNA